MKIDKHLKVAGSLQIIEAIIGLILGCLLVLLTIRDLQRVGSPIPSDSAILIWLPTLELATVILFSSFQIWFGRSLARQKRWATRVVGFIWCFIGLFSFPIGTAINGYTLWVLVQIDKTEAMMTEQIDGSDS